MLKVPEHAPIYLVFDALDECPNTTGISSPRDEVLTLVERLIELNLHNLRLCITSRPEADIRTVVEPLAPNRVSLHDESGQKKDIIDFVTSVVYSNRNMRRWRDEDRKLVVQTLSERANGMYGFSRMARIACSHFCSGSVGSFVNWKSCGNVSRRVCDEFLANCPKHWTRPMNGYYMKFPIRTGCMLTDYCSASLWPFARFVLTS